MAPPFSIFVSGDAHSMWTKLSPSMLSHTLRSSIHDSRLMIPIAEAHLRKVFTKVGNDAIASSNYTECDAQVVGQGVAWRIPFNGSLSASRLDKAEKNEAFMVKCRAVTLKLTDIMQHEIFIHGKMCTQWLR